ncbi:hypothetical protein GCK32_019733 [Trichostrongylus colubriformis]|uniref:Uncharacterized protein n=1 Tax=Trichostrongylus colubriformis TaxID=6319 RepID=A0AAN8F3S8_TRICO
MAPREHNSDVNIRGWTDTARNAALICSSAAPFLDSKWLGEDAPAQEYDNPIRCLGSDPYDDNGIVGRFRTRLWYEKMRKYWIPTWPEAEPDEAKKSRKSGMQAEQGPSRLGWIPKRARYAGGSHEPRKY